MLLNIYATKYAYIFLYVKVLKIIVLCRDPVCSIRQRFEVYGALHRPALCRPLPPCYHTTINVRSLRSKIIN